MRREKIILAFGRRWDRGMSEKYNFKDVREKEKGRRSGLYILYNKKRITYIGKSTVNLRKRISNHSTDHLKNNWDSYSWFITRKRHTSILEALLHNIFWKVKDVTLCDQMAELKVKRYSQKSAIKELKNQ